MEVREPSAKYLARRGYKRTELGVLPEDWPVKPFSELFAFRNGVNADKGAYGQGVPFINVLEPITYSHLYGTEITGQVNLPEPVVASYAVRKGDVLFNRTSETLEEVGLAATYLGVDRVVFGGFVIRGRPIDQSFDPSYLGYALRAPFIRSQIIPMGQGAIRANIGQQNLSLVVAPVPPLLEQRAIAEALGDADALIESLEQLLAKKRNLKQGAMQELLTGKKRLAGFSGAWVTKPLGDLFNFSGGYSASRDQLSTEGFCYLHYGDIHTLNRTVVNVRSEYQDIPKLDVPLKKVSSASLLDDGDVVFVDASEDDEGTSKHVVIINPDKTPFISGLHTIVAKSRTNELDHQYRRYCFQTRAIKAQFRFFAVGTKVSGVSKTNITKITLPVPSAPEQSAIATILSDMDAEIATLETKLVKARNLKQGMMQELLTGRIRLI